MATTQDYKYVPLKDPTNWIRLLKMFPPDDNDPELRGELITCPRNEAPEYQPVSYTWGQQNPTSTIFLRDSENLQCSCVGVDVAKSHASSSSNKDIFHSLTSRPTELEVVTTEYAHSAWRRFLIRPNLEAMLRQFRMLPRTNVFWVDAICIDQENNIERGHQVRNMDQIYRDKALLIWLGEPTNESRVALDLIKDMDRCLAKYRSSKIESLEDFKKLEIQSPSTWKAFRELIKRPWFTRRWIVQEFVLSRHKHAYVGNHHFCFGAIIALCGLSQDRRAFLEDDEHEYNSCQEKRKDSKPYEHVLQAPMLDPIDSLNRLWTVSEAVRRGDTSALTLERLLDNFASFESKDPRDGIYAFLSMASDLDDIDWIPDYSEHNTVTNVYNKAVFHIVGIDGSLDIICHRAHEERVMSHSSRWIPWFGLQELDYSHSHFHSIQGYNTKSLTTFGLPLRALRQHHEGYYPRKCQDHGIQHPLRCDGCKTFNCITGYKCLDCPDFNYCYRCIDESASHHNGAHTFEIHNRTVYFASGISVVAVPPEARMFGHSATCRGGSSCYWNSAPILPAGGFIVDTIQGIGTQGHTTNSTNGMGFSLP